MRTIVDENLPTGRHEAAWDGNDVHGEKACCGIYFCALETGDVFEIKRMVLAR